MKPVWPAISDHKLAFGDKQIIKKCKHNNDLLVDLLLTIVFIAVESIPISTKVTTGHSSVIEARDKIYEVR